MLPSVQVDADTGTGLQEKRLYTLSPLPGVQASKLTAGWTRDYVGPSPPVLQPE